MSKTITRKYIQRITKREGNTSIRQSGGGGGGGGGASQYWVEENYISKLFFNQLFTVYDEDGNVVEPNDTESVIASIKSMFGFWTDAYLSALGNGEGGGAELTLASLADVDVHGVANGQALVYDATTQKWVPGQGGGIDITAMWAALAQSGVQQIDASHLATALTGYATETWVGNQGYITGSALNGYATESWVGSQISDMATKTWVSGNYLSQTNAAATYLTQTNAAATYLTKTDAATTYVSIAFFERLFKAYNGSTVIHPNNTTSTIDNIKAMFGFWTDFYLSALGNGSGGSTPGVTMAQVWSALGNSTTEQINISHLTNALSGYNPTSNFKTINGNSIIGTGDIVVSGGGGTVTSIKVGTTSYSPTDGVVSLPAYPSTLDDIADGSTRKLANYLPLTGGTLTGPLTISKFSASANGNLIIADTTYHSPQIAFGASMSEYKMAFMQFNLTAANTASSSNSIRFHIYGHDNLLNILGTGNVGIGTTSPSYKLHVAGDICATSFIKSGGTSSQFLKADGSVDSNTYATTSSLDSYLPLSAGTSNALTGNLHIKTAGTNGRRVQFYKTDNTTLAGFFAWSENTYGKYVEIFEPITNRGIWIGDMNTNAPVYWNGTTSTQHPIWHSGNFSPSDYLPLSGGTMTGTIYFNTSSNLISGFSNNYDDTRHGVILFGSKNSRYNSSYICHHSKGNGSSENYLTFGLYGADELLRINGLGKSSFYFSNGDEGDAIDVHTESEYDSCISFYKKEQTLKAEIGYSRGLAFISNSEGGGGRIGVNDSNTPQYWTAWNGTKYNLIHSGGGTISGNLIVQQGVNITGRLGSMNGDLIITNNSSNTQIAFGCAMSEYRMAFLQFNEPTKGTASANNSIRFHIYGHNNLLNIFGTGNVGIATTSPSYKLHVAGTFYASGNSSIGGTLDVTGATTLSSTLGVSGATTLSSSLSVTGNSTLTGYVGIGTAASSSYALKVSGVAYASTGFYSGGYVTALSDARHKDVKGDVGLTVGEVANAPAVKFLWKDRRQEGLQVGSIAQYWQKVMPEAIVKNADGELTMSYGVIALLASIATARKVEDHERRIAELERENKLLKEQLNVA